jgi:hypothetical protein
MVVAEQDPLSGVDDDDEEVRPLEGATKPVARRCTSPNVRRKEGTGFFDLVRQATTRITLRGPGRPDKWAKWPGSSRRSTTRTRPRAKRRRAAFAFAFALATTAHLSVALARPTRPRFEPTDLDLEDPGTAEFDLQFGVTHGDGDAGNRLVLPDFEFDLGLTSNVELDLDGAFGIERYDEPTRRLTGEALWTAVKLGFLDLRDATGTRSFAIGAQLGPRIATVGDMRGVGYGALLLLGLNERRLHAVLNTGGFVDPGPQITQGQQRSVVAGLDFSLDLDQKSVWELDSELAVAHYLSPDPDELAASFGASVDASKNVELSLTSIVGFLPGIDRIAILAGVSPKVDIF